MSGSTETAHGYGEYRSGRKVESFSAKSAIAIAQQHAHRDAVRLCQNEIERANTSQIGRNHLNRTQTVQRNNPWQLESAVAVSKIDPEIVASAIADHIIKVAIMIEITHNRAAGQETCENCAVQF